MTDTQRGQILDHKPSRWTRPWHQHLTVFLLFLLLSVAMTYPLTLRLSDHVVNYGDPLLNTWIMSWDIHALQAQPLRLFDANNFYPYENTLAYSENLLSTALLAAPWIWLTGNPVLAHNVLTLLSFAWGGFCAYLLVRRRTGSLFGGIAGGTVFAFAHYRLGQISHIQLLTSWWIPLALYFLERFFSERRNRDLVSFAACFVAQAWATIYLGIFLAGAVLLFLLYHLATRADLRQDRSLWLRLGVAGLIMAATLGVLYVPYSQAREVVGTRELDAQNGAAIKDYLSAHPDTLAGKLQALEPVQESPEHTLFPGFVCVALALWGMIEGGKNWRGIALYLVLGLLSVILSLGPDLRLTRDQPALLKGLPYAVAYRYIPFIRAIRVPARLALLVMLSLAVLAGFGAAALASTLRQHRWIGYGLVIAGLLLDYSGVPITLKPIEVGPQVPPVYQWLGSQEAGSVIFEFPTAESPDITGDEVSIPRLSRHQYFSIYHWQPLTMGYSGFYPPLFWESLKRGLRFPSHESLAYFRGLGVRYLLVHHDELSPYERLGMRVGLTQSATSIFRVGKYGETVVYRLPDRTSVEPGVDLHLPSAATSDRPYYAYALLHLPSNEAWVSRQMSPYQLAFEWRSEAGVPLSGNVHGQLPRVLDSGTTILPLALSQPPDYPATLSVRFRGVSKTVSSTQVVTDQVSDRVINMAVPTGDFQVMDASLDDDLNLTHVHFPRGRNLTAGNPLSVVLYWRKLSSEGQAPTVYIHILSQEGLKVAQVDTPLTSPSIFENHIVPLPWDLPPGSYDVVTGVYDAKTQEPLSESIEIGTIRVEQPSDLEGMVRGPSAFAVGEQIELLGYDLHPSTVEPGQETTLTLYWRPQGEVQRDYKVFTHLLSQDGTILEQQDGQPRNGRRTTSSWLPGEIVVDQYRLTVPIDAQPGLNPLAVGMYLPATAERLPIRDERGKNLPGGRILLQPLRVRGDGRQ